MIAKECSLFKEMVAKIHEELEVELVDPNTRQKVGASDDVDVIYEQIETSMSVGPSPLRSAMRSRRS